MTSSWGRIPRLEPRPHCIHTHSLTGGGGRGGRGGGSPKCWRDSTTIGKTVRVIQGPYIGYVGIIKDATESTARVELHTSCKTISVDRQRLSIIIIVSACMTSLAHTHTCTGPITTQGELACIKLLEAPRHSDQCMVSVLSLYRCLLAYLFIEIAILKMVRTYLHVYHLFLIYRTFLIIPNTSCSCMPVLINLDISRAL